jgi:hypothetical protein
LPVIFYGPGIYAEWRAAVALDQHAAIFPMEVSLHGFFLRAGLPLAGMVFSGLLLLASAFIVWTKRPDVFSTTAVALPVVLLCSPLAWIDYMIVLIPVFIATRWNSKMTGIAISLLIPPGVALLAIGEPRWVSTLTGLIYLLPVLLLAAEYILRLYQPVSAASPSSAYKRETAKAGLPSRSRF